VRILELVLKDFPDARLTMIGPDKRDGSLKNVHKLVCEFSIQDRTVIRPEVPKCDVPALLNEGEIFLNTARIDNTPVSVLEALACGMCVVSTSVGGIPHLLQHRVDALLVPSDDVRAMATSVIAILKNPDLAERLSQNARRKAEQFDWCAVLPLWKSLLTSVMSEVNGNVLEQPHC
jgi:glycosyltransferase involved in cell wall biosynthesis